LPGIIFSLLIFGKNYIVNPSNVSGILKERQNRQLKRAIMLKLYKRIDNEIHYWETWDEDEKTGVVHWGVVGQRGQDKEIKSGLFTSFRNDIQKEIDKVIADGFQEVDIDEHYTLLIEFKVEGMGTPEDVERESTARQNGQHFRLGRTWTL
jgi:hypothetical protein